MIAAKTIVNRDRILACKLWKKWFKVGT